MTWQAIILPLAGLAGVYIASAVLNAFARLRDQLKRSIEEVDGD